MNKEDKIHCEMSYSERLKESLKQIFLYKFWRWLFKKNEKQENL